jgi:hypothetical protein
MKLCWNIEYQAKQLHPVIVIKKDSGIINYGKIRVKYISR